MELINHPRQLQFYIFQLVIAKPADLIPTSEEMREWNEWEWMPIKLWHKGK